MRLTSQGCKHEDLVKRDLDSRLYTVCVKTSFSPYWIDHHIKVVYLDPKLVLGKA